MAPMPINDATVKIVWENNPDAPITASALSKSIDHVASYRDFFATPQPHREGTILMPDADGVRIVMKSGVIFSIINTATKNGTAVLGVNDVYRAFDVGLEDLWLSVLDRDSTGSGLSAGNWGASLEWFVYVCDKFDASLQKTSPDQYGGGAQFLISQGRLYPVGQVPGDPTRNYSADDTRKIGGFKSDSTGHIIPTSVWDVSGKFHTVKAKKYYILDEFADDPEDPQYQRHTYRPLRISDLDSSQGQNNLFSNTITIQGGNLYVRKADSSIAFSVDISAPTPTTSALTLLTQSQVNAGEIQTATLAAASSVRAPIGNLATLNTTLGNITTVNATTINAATVNAALMGNVTGNASGNAGTASRLQTARTISISSGATGSVSFDGSADVSIAIVITNDGHSHTNTTLPAKSAGDAGVGFLQYNGTTKPASGQWYGGSTPADGTARLNYNGHLYATRVYNAVYNDLAEYFVTRDAQIAGRVYCLQPDGTVAMSTKRADPLAVGVFSSTPAFVMKEELKDKGGVPLAMSGTVFVNVSEEVRPGDELVSGRRGSAAKANVFERIFRRSAVIGMALESSEAESLILMLVKR